MAKFKHRIGTIKHQGLLHRVLEWAKKRMGRIYPETEQLLVKPYGPKIRIVYTVVMLLWLISLQVSEAGAIALLRIGAVLFNIDGNKHWLKLKWPAPNFIPLPPDPKDKKAYKAWQQEITKHKLIAQGISCGGNKVRIIGQKGQYWIIECLKPFSGKPPKARPSTHPWLFAWLWEIDVVTGEPFERGLVWPLFSKTGKAYIHKSLVTLDA